MKAYIAKDIGKRWYLVVQEGAGSAYYGIINFTKLEMGDTSDLKAITPEFELSK